MASSFVLLMTEKSLDTLLADADFQRHLTVAATAVGYDAGKVVDVFTSARDAYAAVATEKEAARISSVQGQLHDRILKEGAFYIYGKRPGEYTDFICIKESFRNITKYSQFDYFPMQIFSSETSLLSSDNKTLEIVASLSGELYIEKDVSLRTVLPQLASGELGAVTYYVSTQQQDGWARTIRNNYILIAPQDLCAEIVSFCRQQPNDVFPFFNTIVEEPRYTAQRAGKLYIVDSNKIPVTAFDSRTIMRKLKKLEGPAVELIQYTARN